MKVPASPLALALAYRLAGRGAVLTPSRRSGVHARLRVGRELVVVRARPEISCAAGLEPAAARVVVALQSYVGSTGDLEVRARTPLEGLAWVLGVRREVDIGDLAFAGIYGVAGSPEVARLVLDASSRDALLAMRPLAPVLTLAAGVLELAWAFSWNDVHDALLPPAALAAIVAGSARLRRPWPSAPPTAAPPTVAPPTAAPSFAPPTAAPPFAPPTVAPPFAPGIGRHGWRYAGAGRKNAG